MIFFKHKLKFRNNERTAKAESFNVFLREIMDSKKYLARSDYQLKTLLKNCMSKI